MHYRLTIKVGKVICFNAMFIENSIKHAKYQDNIKNWTMTQNMISTILANPTHAEQLPPYKQKFKSNNKPFVCPYPLIPRPNSFQILDFVW